MMKARRLPYLLLLPLLCCLGTELMLRLVWPMERLRAYATPDDLAFRADFRAEVAALKTDWVQDYYQTDDAHGQYINIDNGFRRTIGQPVTYAHTIWMLGNSTLFGKFSDDSHTIPSQFQQLIDERVVNAGMIGAGITQEYGRLRALPLQPGDTVIFYDGLLEADSVRDVLLRPAQVISPVCLWLVDVVYYDSDLIQHVCGFVRYPSIDNRLPVAVRQTVGLYRTFVDQAAAYCAARGVTFLHVLQPPMYTIPLTRAVELAQRDEYRLDRLYPAVWPAFQASEDGLDLTHVLDDARQRGDVVFLANGRYINAAGNALVARAIYDYLVSTF